MSRQTTWVITGALSILTIGGGTAVVSAMNQSTDFDLGPAMEITTAPTTGSQDPSDSPTTADPSETATDGGTPSPSATDSTGSATSSPTATASPTPQPSAIPPAPPSTFPSPPSTPSTWTPPSTPSSA